MAAYTITITNDGNAAIGPLFLQDLFPPGARFLNATLRPNQIDRDSSNWTLLHLSIGDTIRIRINLNVEKCEGDIINRAFVMGNCSLGRWPRKIGRSSSGSGWDAARRKSGPRGRQLPLQE